MRAIVKSHEPNDSGDRSDLIFMYAFSKTSETMSRDTLAVLHAAIDVSEDLREVLVVEVRELRDGRFGRCSWLLRPGLLFLVARRLGAALALAVSSSPMRIVEICSYFSPVRSAGLTPFGKAANRPR